MQTQPRTFRQECARFLCYYSGDCRCVGCGLDALRQQEGVYPRKPLPRKKIPSDLRSLARGHTALCIKVLAGIVSQETVPAAARVSAASALLDRGWGRAPQVHTDADGGPIRVVIRQLIDVRSYVKGCGLRRQCRGGKLTIIVCRGATWGRHRLCFRLQLNLHSPRTARRSCR
jgi:hypothetical protein